MYLIGLSRENTLITTLNTRFDVIYDVMEVGRVAIWNIEKAVP
jgi:hypothetical protein